MIIPRPLFSVIIPTYNRARKVVRAVESVLAQTLADFDVWVIDDGSSDQTAQALSPYLNHIHYLSQVNSGVAEARNCGMRESSGQYIALLDSDDWWYPQKLGVVAAAIKAHSDVGLFYSQFDVFNEAGEKLWRNQSRAITGSAYRSLLKGDFLAASTTVFKRECIDRVGNFDREMTPCEDWDLWLRIARGYPISLVPEALVAFEYESADKVTADTSAWLAGHDRVVQKAFAEDETLSPAVRQSILANIAYVKGKVCLEANDSQGATRWFKEAAALRPLLFKAQAFKILASTPAVWRFLPRPVRRRLRLPAVKGSLQ